MSHYNSVSGLFTPYMKTDDMFSMLTHQLQCQRCGPGTEYSLLAHEKRDSHTGQV